MRRLLFLASALLALLSAGCPLLIQVRCDESFPCGDGEACVAGGCVPVESSRVGAACASDAGWTGAGAASQRAVGLGVLGGMLAATPFAVIFVPTFFVVVLGLFKTRPRLLGAELRAFEEEQAARKAAGASAQEPAQPNGGPEGKQ